MWMLWRFFSDVWGKYTSALISLFATQICTQFGNYSCWLEWTIKLHLLWSSKISWVSYFLLVLIYLTGLHSLWFIILLFLSSSLKTPFPSLNPNQWKKERMASHSYWGRLFWLTSWDGRITKSVYSQKKQEPLFKLKTEWRDLKGVEVFWSVIAHNWDTSAAHSAYLVLRNIYTSRDEEPRTESNF